MVTLSRSFEWSLFSPHAEQLLVLASGIRRQQVYFAIVNLLIWKPDLRAGMQRIFEKINQTAPYSFGDDLS